MISGSKIFMNNFFRLLPQTILEGHEVAAKKLDWAPGTLRFYFFKSKSNDPNRLQVLGRVFFNRQLFVSLGHQNLEWLVSEGFSGAEF